jgi:hypothetical protein
VVIPTRLAESGIPRVFAALMALFAPQVLPSLQSSGMYALSGPGKLEDALAAARLSTLLDETLEATAVFPDAAAAVDAFLSAGATGLAVSHSGQPAVEEAVHDALSPFIAANGEVRLPGWFRVVQAG